MSLTNIMSSATTGLMAAQTGLRTVSDNIANINTAGYVRKVVNQAPLVSAGMGVGVDITGISRAADAFLQRASLTAKASSAQAGVLADAFDRAQALFGDPSGSSSFFSRLDEVYVAFSAAAGDAASSIQRGAAIDSVTDFLNEASRISTSLKSLGAEADARIGGAVDRANQLLSQIDSLNTDISRAQVEGRDSTGSENIQTRLIDELSGLMDVSISSRSNGGSVIRASDGTVLAGAGGAATLSYVRADGASGEIAVTLPGASGQASLRARLTSGEIRGLLDLRDRELPAIGDQLSEFVTKAVDELNRAHNASSSVPAPSTLTGRNTGLDLPTAIAGFSGQTTIGVVAANGLLQRQVAVDFDAGTMSVDGGGPTAFTAGNFLSTLNTALGGFGSAGFSNGALSLTANGGAGVAIVDDAANPATKAAKGFSHFFGLNDLVTSTGFPFYDTGLSPTSAHGFTTGDTISLRVADADGVRVKDVTVAVPAGGTMADLLGALNSNTSGVGLYGAFSLDAEGAMVFSANARGASLSVLNDDTERGAGGPSISELFGVGLAQRSGRAERFEVRTDIAANPLKLALASLDLSQASAGKPVLALGDGRGATGLAQAGETFAGFDAAGGLAASTMTVSRYASELAGAIARKADAAASRQTIAEAVASEADTRRSSAEGVNLDQELISMTTYQQAFNASARLVQASKDMYDILMTMVR
ncbi:MAG: flagellar hook-associated protein FlgK [Caulobacter sp.]|nr:flagellar hook-associated protein FlgK [Caulobacter sp.]